MPLKARALSTLAAAAALAAAAPNSASAKWERVISTPSRTQPYAVCPSRPRTAGCELIEDPTRGSHARGPLPAGAITKGPVQEVSPATSGSGVEGGYAPSDLQAAYLLPSSSAGGGQTVAVVDAFDDPNAEADLAVYRSQYGLPECTVKNGCFRKVNQRGEAKLPAPEQKWAKEISVDLDMVSAICPHCHVLLVEADSEAAASLAAAENTAVALGATEISNSYEEEQSSEGASAYAHPGIPIAVAAGDKGYGPVSPAASPHVIAVGGTSLTRVAGRRGWEETVWHGTGGGCSIEPKPSWQTDAGCANRTANDIAAVADPNTPVSAYDSYQEPTHWMLLGGTSVSAPIVAATMALATPYTRSFDGAQALYLDVVNGGGFNDVVSGMTGSCGGSYLCEAKRGYDGPSGLGTLNGAPDVPPPAPLGTGASSVTQHGATLLGSVNPHGVQLSSCVFQYGTTSGYGSVAPCMTVPGAGTNPVAVAAGVTGLSPGTVYHFRLEVTYAGGTAASADLAFTSAGLAPTITATEATNVAASSVSLNAQVNPNGARTECAFEYGATASYGSAAPCSPAPGAGQSPVSVMATISGLIANSIYHFRVVASNVDGTTYGPDQVAALPPFAPVVATRAATAVGRTSASLNAIVNANGGTLATCEFEFNSGDTLIPCSSAPAPLAGVVAVSAKVKGLASGSTYSYRIVAANAGGSAYGSLEQFVTLPSPSQLAERYAARLASPSLTVDRGGTLRIKIRCPAPHHARCRGTVSVRGEPAGGERYTTAGGSLALASGTFAVAAGRVVTLHLQLAARARAVLARAGHLRASVTVRTIERAAVIGVWHGTGILSSGP